MTRRYSVDLRERGDAVIRGGSISSGIACLMTSMASAAKMGHHLRAAARRWWEGTGRGIAGRQGRARVRPPLSFPGGLNGYPGVLGPDDKQRTRKRCQAP